MSFAEYRAILAINASALKQGRISMLHMRHEMTRADDDPTDAMSLGTLLHAAILEPDTLPHRFAVWDGGARRGKDWELFKSSNAERNIVTADWMALAVKASSRVWANDRARGLLDGATVEKPVLWTHPQCGACKARLDGIARDGRLFDIKTCRQIGAFSRQFASLGYDIQCGWYADGWKRSTGQARDMWLIVVETVAPYDVACWRVPAIAMQRGLELAVEIGTEYRACKANGVYPGVQGADDTDMPLPEWYVGPGDVDLDDIMPMDDGNE
jgi:hypothetical protein